jgi:hypothetical protein
VSLSDRTLGALLIALGFVLIVGRWVGVGAEAIVALLGVGFLAAYVATRAYGFLIPGGILTGLGTGIVVATAGGPSASPVLGLGVGFLTIAVVDRVASGWERPGWWWPLIPGGILTIVGVSEIPELEPVVRYLLPAALIAVGIWLIAFSPRRRAERQAPEDAPVTRTGRTD